MRKIEIDDHLKAQRILNKVAKQKNLRFSFQNTKTFFVVYLVDANGNIPLALYRDKILKRAFLFLL